MLYMYVYIQDTHSDIQTHILFLKDRKQWIKKSKVQGYLNICKTVKMTLHYNGGENSPDFLARCGKAFDKIYGHFMVTLSLNPD